MKTKNIIFYLISSLICFSIVGFPGCKSGEATENQVTILNISVSQAFELIQDNQYNENFIILDVRSPLGYQETHLENTVNIDYYSENFQNNLAEMDKNKKYLVYCHSGNRSAQATNIMINMGFNKVYNMLGGISAWISAGYPVISGSGLIYVWIQILKR